MASESAIPGVMRLDPISSPRPRRRSALAGLAVLASLPVAFGGLAAPGAVAAGAAPVAEVAAEEGDVWEDVHLPAGFYLDLATGRVTDRAPEGEALVLEGGELVALDGGVGTLDLAAARVGGVARGEQVSGSRWAARRDLLLGVELGVRGWGVLRVLEVGETRVRLERWSRPGGAPGRASWLPRRFDARSGAEGGVVLDPPTASAGPWSVEVRALRDRAWTAIGEWDGAAPFVDDAAPEGEVREYRLVPLERADGSRGDRGLRARGVAGVRAGGTTPAIEREDAVDLVTGRVGGARQDAIVAGVTNTGVNLSPGPGVRFASLGTGELDEWIAPDEATGRYAAQHRYLPIGRDFTAITADGLYVHVVATSTPGGNARLVCRPNLWGERTFPTGADPRAWSWTREGGVVLEPPPDPPKLVRDAVAGWRCERERGFESNEWESVGAAAIGAPIVDSPDGEGLVRYRACWVAASGERGPYGAPLDVLAGDASSDAWVARFVEELGDPDYETRRRAQAALAALGARALPHLERGLQSADPQVASAARELYGRLVTADEDDAPQRNVPRVTGKAAADAQRDPKADPKGAEPAALAGGRDDEPLLPAIGPRALLRSLADARDLGAAPAGWLDDDAGRRAAALLAAAAPDAPADDREPWRALLAEADPDPAVRLVAGLFPELARPESWAPSFAPAGDEADVGAGEDALSVAAQRGLDPARPWPSLARLQVLHDLDLARPGTADEAAARDRAMLALDLLRRFEDTGEDVFLDAALQVVAGPRARLRAARNLFALRAESRDVGGERARFVLPEADGALLRDTLEGMRGAEDSRVDIVLPAGDYGVGDRELRTVRVYGDGVRIVGEGRVRLGFGLLLVEDAGVVVENVEFDPEGAACLRLQDGSATLIGCRLQSAGQGVQVSNGVLEMIDCELVDAALGGKGGNGIRLNGRSACRLVRTRIDAGGDALVGARLALVERCVLDGGGRNAVSGMSEGELIAEGSVIRAGQYALHGVGRGVLEACVLLGESGVGLQLGERFHACPSHLLTVGAEGDRNEWRPLDGCPVGR